MANSTKRKRFVRLAQSRVGIALKRIAIIGHCANPSYYEYDGKDVESIHEALQKTVDNLHAKFLGGLSAKGRKGKFTL